MTSRQRSAPASILQGVEALLRPLAVFRADLHRNPELSGQERRTAERLARWLGHAGCEVFTGVGGHGVVARLRNGEGPLVLLRAELDALPVREETGLSYASTVTAARPDGRVVPVAHACGHDIHMTCLAGTAELLAANRASWRGTVLLVGQPAEETLTGAAAMLDDGLYQRFGVPDVALAQHVAPLPAGVVAHAPPGEPLTAAGAELRIVIRGRGGHGGMPHLAVDPVVVAASVVLRLRAMAVQERRPGEHVVVTVGALHAGERANVIPDSAVLEAIVRAPSLAAVDRVVEVARRVVEDECLAARCTDPPEFTVVTRVPAGISDPVAAARVRRAHLAVFGAGRVVEVPQGQASEDFPLFGADGRVPTVYWYVGSVPPAVWDRAPGAGPLEKLHSLPAAHSPKFSPDPVATLRAGITALAAGALAWLGTGPLGNGEIMSFGSLP